MASRRSTGDETSLWPIVVYYRWPAIVCAGTVVLLAIVLAVLSTPVYRVSVLTIPNVEDDAMQLASLSRQFGGLASLAGIDLGSDRGDRTAAIATLRSRAFTERFIEDNGLLPILFADRWDEAEQEWMLGDDEEPPSIRDGFRKFDKQVRFVEEEFSTGLVRLVVEWTDRDLAAKWANALISSVNEVARKESIRQTRVNMEYLERELAETNVLEIRNAVYGLIEDQVRRAMMANVRESFAFRVIDPAVVPDVEEYVRPNRILMVGLAILFSPIIGVLVALFLGFVAGLRKLPELDMEGSAIER